MKVGVPREIKNNEFRVAITPVGVHELVQHGHEVLIEDDAGAGSSITNWANRPLARSPSSLTMRIFACPSITAGQTPSACSRLASPGMLTRRAGTPGCPRQNQS